MAGARHSPGRRRLLAGLAAAIATGPVRAQPEPRLLVISRKRVLRETAAGRALTEAEAEIRDAFQDRVEAAKRALEAREAELARLRGTLPRSAFREQTEAFDRAVRSTRRATQRQAALMQKAIRQARERLASALPPILVAVLKDRGADVVLDTDAILVARPEADVTQEVIARFDAEVEPFGITLGDQPPLLPEDFTHADQPPDPATTDGG